MNRLFSARRYVSVLSVLGTALALAACEETSPGRFELQLVWPGGVVPSDPDATIFAEVRKTELGTRGMPLFQEARPLAVADPVGVSEAARLQFNEVPHGDNRIVVVEVRESRNPDSELLLFGLSEPFALRVGETTVVSTRLDLMSPPTAEVVISEGSFVRQPEVTLEVTTNTGVRVHISNFDTFPSDRTEVFELSTPVNLGCGEPRPMTTPCRYRLSWNLDSGRTDRCENLDRCERTVSIQTEDQNGVRSTPVVVNGVLDTRAPGLQAVVSYRPAEGNPLPKVEAATAGTRVVVELVATEQIQAPPLSFQATGDRAGTLTFSQISTSAIGGSYETALTTEGLPANGVYSLDVVVSDLAGNPSGAPHLPAGPVEILKTAPTLVVDQRQVSFIRAPVGNAEPEDLGNFVLPAGPAYFALAPPDGLQNTNVVSASAFVLAGLGTPTALRVWADLGLQEPLTGEIIRPDSSGAWLRSGLTLASVDTPRVYVTGLDRAGNESAPVRIQNAWFVASTARPRTGGSPHALSGTALGQAPLERYSGTALGQAPLERHSGTALGQAPLERQEALAPTEASSSPDGQAIVRTPRSVWLESGFAVDPHRIRSRHAMVYDSARARTVTFGGAHEFGLPVFAAETWEWDGTRWTDETPAGLSPSPRRLYGMAYDSIRGRVVLFGGDTGGPEPLSDTWEWDGETWIDVTPAAAGPTARSEHNMAFDSARGRVVLFGGIDDNGTALDDTWEWDGAAWVATDQTTRPPARSLHAMTFDPTRDCIIIYGGRDASGAHADIWERDALGWRVRTPSGSSPDGSVSRRMVFHHARGRAVLYLGPQFWEWDGLAGRWTEFLGGSGSGPGHRTSYAMAYDVARDRVLVHGGEGPHNGPGLREWDGQVWFERAELGPMSRSSAFASGPDATMAYDSERDLLGNLNQGQSELQWSAFTRGHWSEAQDTGIPTRSGYALAYDAARDRFVLFGGFTQETWTRDPATSLWQNVTPASGNPMARGNHAMAYDVVNRRIVMFGGVDNNGQDLSDTCLWNGVGWVCNTPSVTPPAQRGAAMAYDQRRSRVVLFGVSDGTSSTWEWDGVRWERRTSARGQPTARSFHAMAYDSNRERVFMFGGSAATGSAANDLWAWDGTGWDSIVPLGFPPTARLEHAAGYDASSGRLVIVGGREGGGTLARLNDTWVLAVEDQPAVQFAAQLPAELNVPGDVTAFQVRAFCGGRFESSSVQNGAELFGWIAGGEGRVAGVWQRLASNEASSPIPERSLQTALMTFPPNGDLTGADRGAELFGPDRRMYFQCRPAGFGRHAEVAMDYMEVRVRYRTTD